MYQCVSCFPSGLKCCEVDGGKFLEETGWVAPRAGVIAQRTYDDKRLTPAPICKEPPAPERGKVRVVLYKQTGSAPGHYMDTYQEVVMAVRMGDRVVFFRGVITTRDNFDIQQIPKERDRCAALAEAAWVGGHELFSGEEDKQTAAVRLLREEVAFALALYDGLDAASLIQLGIPKDLAKAAVIKAREERRALERGGIA